MPLRLAVVCLALLLIYPQDSLAAAREAFALWQQTVAPSLLPFFALIPALTCPEATAAFAHLLKWPCRLLAVPEQFAGAVGIAFAAGSPAGARAMMRIAAQGEYSPDALFRTAMLCAGASPGFIVSGVGAGMLADPSDGMILLLAQAAALCISARLLQWVRLPQTPRPVRQAEAAADPPPVMYAANGVLSILVWMVVFAAGTRIAQRLLPALAGYLPFAAEFSAGCAHVAALSLPRAQTLPLLGAVIGFGGVCAGCQNLSALRPLGIPPQMYFCAKAIHAALCALFARALLQLRLPAISFAPQPVLLLLSIACLLPIFHKIVTPAPK